MIFKVYLMRRGGGRLRSSETINARCEQRTFNLGLSSLWQRDAGSGSTPLRVGLSAMLGLA